MPKVALQRLSLSWLVVSCLVIPSTGVELFSRSQTEGHTRSSAKTKSIVYVNKKYGFRFSLPKSWKGYSIIIGEWEGGDGGTYAPGEVMPPPIKGPFITIRHPLWTESRPRQDIPILIFTTVQWKLVEQGTLIMSSAPIGPGELGRNAKYVFALPARYDYALEEGYEEVNGKIYNEPLKTF